MTATTTSRTTAASRDPLVAERPDGEACEPLRGAAARRGPDEQREAGPHERHRQGDDDVGHAGDDDERRR